jgi:diguanylate cyclase (GGDEF)-like protein
MEATATDTYRGEITVLLVDDEVNILQALKRLLSRKSFRIVTATSADEALKLLAQLSNVALIVSDQRMPEMNGAELLRRSRELAPEAVRILLTGYSDLGDAVDAINLGGISRYLSKPWDDTELLLAVRGALESYMLVQENHRLQELVRQQASTDFLTGLVNRRELKSRFDVEKSRSERHGTPFSTVIADLDYFKQVNDVHGHLAGDCVLKAVADTFISCVRAEDCCGRWGGEEFLLLLAGTDLAAAGVVAEKLRLAVSKLTIPWNREELQVTVSLGVSAFRSGMSMEECVKLADDAMYRAKIAGRNRVELVEE